MNTERMYEVLRTPVISEKASTQTENANQVAFEVRSDATKPEIAAAVAKLFDVTVKKVNTVAMPSKTKRFRGFAGKRNGWRKAYVTLGDGDQIDFLGSVQ
ncbi:50S ribosomal protein L23 [Salinisphaera sp. USBA-960]|uniref:50S ribosomal protein L23 n=1 Tax=Salinisphaera orenii TaxID=856731 RepID=UPI000DBE33EA|nr:50S ribosomal protein L23 [Salifodinibacter halophilus]NNC26690.1 50S ribosomal protein L23 [Salifodinibacter halophilus]